MYSYMSTNFALHDVPIHFTFVGRTFSKEDLIILIKVADSAPPAFTLYFDNN